MGNIETEVLVVGAGPAGSIAAHQIASSGFEVTLLDRAKFPRDKPCGGGVTVRCESLLPFSIDPVVEDIINSAEIALRDEKSIFRESSQTLTYMTQRSKLDAFLAEKAQESGAVFRDSELVQDIRSLAGDGFSVTTKSGTRILSKVVLGADGANGITANRLGYDRHLGGAVALEGNIYFPEGVPERFAHTVVLNFGYLTDGYGWIFPKKDHINIGVGASRDSGGKRLTAALTRLAEIYGVDLRQIENLRGHHLPMRHSSAPLTQGGSALLGDAAGLVDPLSGEGIFAALSSGMAIAPVVGQYLTGQSSSLGSYATKLEKDLIPEIETSHALMEILHAYPRPFIWMLQHLDLFWTGAIDLIRGDSTYIDLTARFGTVGRKLLTPTAMAGSFIARWRRNHFS